MEEMKDFHDTHSNLSQWLSAKDRMMTALGPISSDSRMVQTQVQQVSSLLCYFFSYFVCNLRMEMIRHAQTEHVLSLISYHEHVLLQ